MRWRFSFSLLLFLLSTLLGACSGSGQPPAPAGLPTLPPQAILQVIRPDGKPTPFGLEDLKKLPAVQMSIDGITQTGPLLSTLLAAAGVTDFTEVTLTGGGATYRLTRAQVNEQTMLDFNNRGMVKLASTLVAKDLWVKDITLIQVK